MRFLFLASLFSIIALGSASAADKPNYKEIKILNGESASSLIDISTITPGNGSALGLFMPSAWTTANLTVQVSPTCDTPWYNAYDGAGNEYTIVAGVSRYIGLDSAYFIGVRCIKFVSGTSGLPVNQAATRTIKVGYGRFNQ